jgi:tetratricopeptide (TPR) repeat protein
MSGIWLLHLMLKLLYSLPILQKTFTAQHFWISKANAALEKKECSEAIKFVNKVIEYSPTHAYALYLRGLALAQIEGEGEHALEDFNKSIKSILTKDNRADDGWEILTEKMRLIDRNQFCKGLLYLNSFKQPLRALQEFEMIVHTGAPDMEVYTYAAQAAYDLKKFDTALLYASKALRKYIASPKLPAFLPTEPDELKELTIYSVALELLLNSCIFLEKFNDTIDYCDRVIFELDKKIIARDQTNGEVFWQQYKSTLLSKKAMVAMASIDYLKAIDFLSDAILFSPKDSLLYELRYKCYEAIGDSKKAVDDLIIATELSPEE